MSLLRLSLVVIFLIGGTAAAVLSYVESRRPLPEPVVIEHQERLELEHPSLPTSPTDLEESAELTAA